MNRIRLEEIPYRQNMLYRIAGMEYPKLNENEHFERTPIFINFYNDLKLDTTFYDPQTDWVDETIISDEKGNIVKRFPVFTEVFIDDIPFSYYLDHLFKNRTPLLYNFSGYVGRGINIEFEKLYIRQLLNHEITEEEVVELFDSDATQTTEEKLAYLKDDWDFQDVTRHIENRIVKMYGCPKCYSDGCGGYYIKIAESTESYFWLIDHQSRDISNVINHEEYADPIVNFRLEFDKVAYKRVFEAYLKSLEGDG